MLQWASGGMLFLWFTFRSGEISVGYAKLLRGVYATIALGGAALGFALDRIIIREVAALVLVALAIVGFARRARPAAHGAARGRAQMGRARTHMLTTSSRAPGRSRCVQPGPI